jgi:hypothetical protein
MTDFAIAATSEQEESPVNACRMSGAVHRNVLVGRVQDGRQERIAGSGHDRTSGRYRRPPDPCQKPTRKYERRPMTSQLR